jgi:excisionase family DNA binding protein
MSALNLGSPRELAKRTGWPVRRIRTLIAENRIRHVRVGRSILVPFDAIEEFLRENLVTPGADDGR